MTLARSVSLTKRIASAHVSSLVAARNYTRGADVPGLDASKLVIEKTSNPKPKPATEGLLFGKEFSDHMLTVDWDSESGWAAPVISETKDLQISPAAMALHYAIQCFEGMKAYKDAQGRIRLFRPDCNIERLNNSMKRLYLPQLDPDQLMECLKTLVKTDQDWIPEGDGFSLYLRPTSIATDPYLGLQVVNQCKFFVITSPVGPYYTEGFKPVKLLADDQNVRAWPGGCGSSKLGGNYGPTIAPQMAANEQGCAQVLWLYPDGDDHIVTEVGAMNLFFVIKTEDGKTELVTAPLTDGTILPGVTRRSVLELAQNAGEMIVSERPLGMKEIIKAHKEGRLMEAFGAGTAAVIAPVNSIRYKGEDIDLPTGDKIGPVGQQMWNDILDIQYGRVEHPWSVLVE
jgi:branched-chain amino acid aminotransferase